MASPTLLELLESLAVHHQERATSSDVDGFSKWVHGDLANHAREARERLRSEMERAEELLTRPHSRGRTKKLLELINGGPISK